MYTSRLPTGLIYVTAIKQHFLFKSFGIFTQFWIVCQQNILFLCNSVNFIMDGQITYDIMMK